MTTLHIRICPTIARTAATAAVAGVALTLAAPTARADDIPIRSAVDGLRGGSGCPALHYRDDLAGAAYAYARGGGPAPTNGYPGRVQGFKGYGDPAAQATHVALYGSKLYENPGARDAILDCRYQDFGVSLLRDELSQQDTVAIVLGEPTPQPPTPQPTAPQPPLPKRTLGRAGINGPPPPQTLEPGTPTATVTSDVDVYDVPGGGGNVIGILRQGEVVKVVKACLANDWCALADGRFAFGQFFKNN